MPGLWGAAGEGLASFSHLNSLCRRTWPGSDQFSAGSFAVGAHSHSSQGALRVLRTGTIVALDGEAQVYQESLPPELDQFGVDRQQFALPELPALRGNMALFSQSAETLQLIVECTGTFPLYACLLPRGVLFSSLLRPLARTRNAPMDALGVLEFLRDAYTCNGRTLFAGIQRLLPGQVLSWTPDASPRITESSSLWASDFEALDVPEVADAMWEKLTRSVAASLPSTSRSAIMMSAGWDSRTLLAGALATRDAAQLVGYSHGDLGSRELTIVSELCRTKAVPCHLEPIDDDIFRRDRLAEAFDRTETAMFPHWHRAGDVLARAGVQCITAGVYGEILGGHYGSSMVSAGLDKVFVVGTSLLGRRQLRIPSLSWDALERRLLAAHYEVPSVLCRDFVHSLVSPLEAMNQDISTDITRLRARGIETPERVLEAYVSEHRGSQFINSQLLSARAYADVALPFAEIDLLSSSTRVPFDAKVHNRLNRLMLERHASDFLRFPLAATLVDASAPIILQEASRLVRKAWEDARWRAHFASGQRISPPRLGWVNFEFLRSGRSLAELVDRLQLEIWDRDALRRRVDEVQRYEWRRQLHPVFDHFSRIATVDGLLAPLQN